MENSGVRSAVWGREEVGGVVTAANRPAATGGTTILSEIITFSRAFSLRTFRAA